MAHTPGDRSSVTSPGGVRADLHVKVLDHRVVSRAKAAGLSVLVYAPHFVRLPAIEATAARYSDADLTVIPGREIFTGTWRNRKHVLALGLDRPIPDYITLEAAMDDLASQDAVILIPHPTFARVSFAPADIRDHQAVIHAIETYNPKHLPYHNTRAHRLATEYGLPEFGSSYAHLRGTVGEVWTTFPDCDPTEPDIVTAVRTNAPRTVHHRDGITHQARCVLERSHLFYENTVSRLQYTLRESRGTSPHHPAYEGRFDAAAVYPPP